jgi:GTP-binding protein
VKFIDEATISVQSGDGGAGCVSFRREKFIPRGGPDGGDGGRGGDVIISANARKRTLYHFRFKRSFQAEKGASGQANQRSGKAGADLEIEVPPGTLVRDAQSDEILRDLTRAGERFVIAKGGRGGLGNKHFATSTHRTPRFAQPGEPGQTFTVKLELKLLADVGIIGLPNAGKSTLIGAISSAHPKIGDYPFTTLTPNLGVVRPVRGEPFVIADLPGIIEGAHEGAGLGTRFLRHTERTTVLLHLIDAAAIDPGDPLQSYRVIRHELAAYRPSLAEKQSLIVLNKIDVPGAETLAEAFRAALGNEREILFISALARTGLDAMTFRLLHLLDRSDDPIDE